MQNQTTPLAGAAPLVRLLLPPLVILKLLVVRVVGGGSPLGRVPVGGFWCPICGVAMLCVIVLSTPVLVPYAVMPPAFCTLGFTFLRWHRLSARSTGSACRSAAGPPLPGGQPNRTRLDAKGPCSRPSPRLAFSHRRCSITVPLFRPLHPAYPMCGFACTVPRAQKSQGMQW